MLANIQFGSQLTWFEQQQERENGVKLLNFIQRVFPGAKRPVRENDQLRWLVAGQTTFDNMFSILSGVSGGGGLRKKKIAGLRVTNVH